MDQDSVTPNLGIKRWQLAKYEGAAPRAGEHKQPIEIIEGGDDIETRVVFRRPGADPQTYSTLPYHPHTPKEL